MKKRSYFLLICICSFFGAFAQIAPSTFSYQAVIRTADGRLLKNTPVTLVISIRPGQSATPVWQETQNSRTDAFGVVGLELGSGTNQVSGPANFSGIQFGTAGYWVKITRNNANGPVITDQKLLSVPYANYALTSGNTFPAGIIVPFAGDTSKVPVGWLLCDGASLNINASDPRSNIPFNALYAAVGTAWGSIGAGQFNLPDLRGMFLRGVSRISSNDPDKVNRIAINIGGNLGNNVGSLQGDIFSSHQHVSGSGGAANVGGFGLIRRSTPGQNATTNTIDSGGSGSEPDLLSIPAQDNVVGGSETRPKNVYVHYIIKL